MFTTKSNYEPFYTTEWGKGCLALFALFLAIVVPELYFAPECPIDPAMEEPVIEEQVFVEPEPELPVMTWHEAQFGRKPFFTHLTELGLAPVRIHTIAKSVGGYYDFRKSSPRHTFRLGFEEDIPKKLEIHVSPSEIFDVDLEGEIAVSQREIETFVRPALIEGVIEQSVFMALSEQRDAPRLAALMEKVFAWDIDFHTDPRVGDRFEMLVEENWIDHEGEPLFTGYGDVLVARYIGSKANSDAYRFEMNGKTSYFNGEGESMVRKFLRSPMKMMQVTSRFSPRRFHPILKKWKSHRGVDYGAPKGTPVMAVADGTVVTAGWTKGGGRTVEVRHSKKLITQYAHFSKFGKGIKKGVRVKQGQIVGYVGKTGWATGYHLHFGVKVNGKHIDPLKMKFEPGEPIPEKYRARFEEQKELLLARLTQATGPEQMVKNQ